MFYACNYNIRVTHRNGAIKRLFTRIRSTEGSSADCSLFILSLHALALHLAVENIASNLSVWRFEHVGLTYICEFMFPPRMPAGPHFVTQPILLSENIPNIWRTIINKTQGGQTRLNDKNDNTNYAPSYHMSFTNGSGCHFKEIFDQVRKDLDCELFYSVLKRHNVSFLLSNTDNIHIINLKTITPC